MTKDYNILISHILECIGKIEEYTNTVTKDAFFKSTQTQDAVMRRIEIIGEAVKHIPQEIKDKYY